MRCQPPGHLSLWSGLVEANCLVVKLSGICAMGRHVSISGNAWWSDDPTTGGAVFKSIAVTRL